MKSGQTFSQREPKIRVKFVARTRVRSLGGRYDSIFYFILKNIMSLRLFFMSPRGVISEFLL